MVPSMMDLVDEHDLGTKELNTEFAPLAKLVRRKFLTTKVEKVLVSLDILRRR